MLTAKQLNQYADVLIWGVKTARTKQYKRNDIVLVHYDLPAIKLAEILQEKLLGLGINPVLRLGPTVPMEKIFYKKSNQNQLVFQAPGTKELFESLNGAIYLYAPESLTHLKDIDPKRIAKALIARKPFRDILSRREEIGSFGWTLCTLPTLELAKQARLSFEEYTRQIATACYLDESNPVKAWNSIYNRAQTIKKWLNSMKVNWYHIESKNIDLRITPGKQRRWIGISGHNIPSFELFLSPDWRGTEGTYFANQPSFRSGNYVKGVRLEFKKGSVNKIKAEKGEEFTIKQLAMDTGAKRVGEFSLTDRRFSKIDRFMANTLFDENFGGPSGNCHIAVGSSYSDTYRGNPAELTHEKKKHLGLNDSALHWDLVNTEEKMVTAHLFSGKKVIIYEKGEFKYQ
ncbi:MAG: aminopeptidase [Thermodesulfobacteriota bacterium]|jgi:aminopeptidase|nr:MAG: aminopeptidase [Thermodesulfobacteriota bacterium]